MLRLATIEDAEAIATIHIRTWQTVYEGIIPAQHLASLSIQKRADSWRRTISERHGTVLLAVASHGEAGLISFGPSRDKDGNDKAEIYAIYVLPKFWHQGIGRELLEGAERRIKDNRFIAVTLWVLEKNVLARRFYEARGFRLDAARKEETICGLLLVELRYEKRIPVPNQPDPVGSAS